MYRIDLQLYQKELIIEKIDKFKIYKNIIKIWKHILRNNHFWISQLTEFIHLYSKKEIISETKWQV